MAQLEHIVGTLTQALKARSEIAESYLFGSYARGEERDNSDIDIAVFLSDEPETPYGYDADLAAEIMRAVDTNRVDVVILNRAPPLLYHRVLRDGIRLFARDLSATTTREGRALSMYCDFALQLAKVDAVAAARTKTGEFGR